MASATRPCVPRRVSSARPTSRPGSRSSGVTAHTSSPAEHYPRHFSRRRHVPVDALRPEPLPRPLDGRRSSSGSALLVLGLRWWWGLGSIWNTEVVLAVAALTAAPVGFLAGIGSFDYWLHYVVGRPTEPEDLGSRRSQLEGLLPRQHRPQGHRDQVPRHDLLLLHGRRPHGDVLPRGARRLRASSSSTRRPSTGSCRRTRRS